MLYVLAGNPVKLRVMHYFAHNGGTVRMVSDEAVEAAAKLIALEMGTPSSPTIYRHLARKALEAAAPYMLAEAEDSDNLPDAIRQWTGSEWITVVSHPWDAAKVTPYDPMEAPHLGDLRVFGGTRG